MTRLLAVVVACGCGSSSPVAVTSIMSSPRPIPVPGRDPSSLRVMSYNVNFGLAGDVAGAAAIASGSPDVVFLQETNDDWAAVLIAALPRFAFHRFEPPHQLPAGGMGVMSVYPIESIDTIDSIAGPFFAWRVIVDAPAGRIQVLDVHLRPPMSDSGSWVVGYFSTREDRERELSSHAERLDPKLPTLIVGDFNEEADGRAVAVAEGIGYIDAIAQFKGATRTWEWPVGRFTLRFQLDHLMYDRRFVATAAGIIEAGRSDHKPIWADLEVVTP